MPYKSFVIPALHAGWAECELNSFIGSHRVLSVERRWVDQGQNSYWAVWVDYLDSPLSPALETVSEGSKKRIDYKEVLSPEDFEAFAQLRTLRKEIAREDGVQLYAVFTNEQLAQIVQGRVTTKEQLSKISGVGEARVAKHGARFLELASTIWKENNEAGGGPVSEDHGA